MPWLLLIKMNSLTADDRYSNALAFCVFNPPKSLFGMKGLGDSFLCSMCCYDDLNQKRNVERN